MSRSIIIDAFERLLKQVGGNVRHIVFDLDATLGDTPGWHSHQESLDDYVHFSNEFRHLLKHLRFNRGISATLVSRNGSFCGDLYHTSAAQAKQLGFHWVAPCSRAVPQKPKTAFLEYEAPHTVLLIDDQHHECEMAAKHGSTAVLCEHDPIIKTLLTRPHYKIFRPHSRYQRRRRTQKRR